MSEPGNRRGLLSAKSLRKRFHREDGRGQKPGRGPGLVGDLSLRGGPRLGTDQKPGRGPSRMEIKVLEDVQVEMAI